MIFKIKYNKIVQLTTCCLICFSGYFSFSQEKPANTETQQIESQIAEVMSQGEIPGLTVVIIKDGKQVIKNYGYSNLKDKSPVTPQTLFELGSNSKAFTAMAVMDLIQKNQLKLTANVSAYIPWFRPRYKNKPVNVTVEQLLHHTSGIPWTTISKIPVSTQKDALQQTVRQVANQVLVSMPGTKFEYATINYDVLALIIENITQKPFETYLQQHIIDPLQLSNTTVGVPADPKMMATGYKIGFFEPRAYTAPRFNGNNAAGYVISNATDVARWLKFQMGIEQPALFPLAALTHQRDETVPLHEMSAYAMGWEISLSGNKEIYHNGLNPNFTSYLAFSIDKKTGVAVLANSNSSYTDALGDNLMKLLTNQEIRKNINPANRTDKIFSIASCFMLFYLLAVLIFMIKIIIDVSKRKRKYEPLSFSKLKKFAMSFVLIFPVAYGIYLMPKALIGFTWDATIIWTPASMIVCLALITGAVGLSYVAYLVSLCFPHSNKFRRVAPMIVLMSILSGLANMVVIILITSSINSSVELKYLVSYYVLTITVYLLISRYVNIQLTRFSRELTYELRIMIIDKVFSTSYQKFEKIDRGRVYTALNDDVSTLGGSSDQFVMVVTNIFTVTGAFLYLATIAFWATAMTIFLLIALSVVYYLVSNSTNKYFEAARDTRNVLMRLINGMVDGFKEISLHKNKKLEYKKDMALCADEYREKVTTANIYFVNAFLVGESFLILLLGIVAFAIPKYFPDIKSYSVVSFILVLLYLIGPIKAILGSVPVFMQLRIAWNRIQEFLKEIPANLDLKEISQPKVAQLECIKAEGLKFRYETRDGQEDFQIGPIDLEVGRGEILFIIGGNGSGKTTLAKLITGLYEPDSGHMTINGEVITGMQLSEYFSTVFSPAHLFEKLYNIDLTNKSEQVKKYLALLHLEDKVKISDGIYSTINLSGGQRKRLALLQCYLEDSPIYLFDEWAADQDPEYRNFFYRTLLPEMKQMGKIVIAITHDDHYFDIADKVMKMKEGKLEVYSVETPLTKLFKADI